MNWRELPAGVELDHVIAGRLEQTPKYSTDVDAALSLLRDVNWRLSFDRNYGLDGRTGYSVSIDGSVFVEFAATPALAICQAWLAYMDTKENR